MRRLDVPWARCAPARMLREAILQFGLAPLMDLYTRRRVYGREIFRRLPHPVIFVANHSSHLDTPTILRALPLQWRQRTAVAAAADYFYKKRAVANMVALIFNTVPLARHGGGVGNGSTAHVDTLLDTRWNLLMFPEGTRSRGGQLGEMRSGAAVDREAARHPDRPDLRQGHARRDAAGAQLAQAPPLHRAAPPRRGPLRVADLARRGRAPQRGHGARALVPRGRGRRTATAARTPPSRSRPPCSSVAFAGSRSEDGVGPRASSERC